MIIEILFKLIVYTVTIAFSQIVVAKLRSGEGEIVNSTNDVAVVSQKYPAKVFFVLAIFHTLLIIFVSSMPLNVSGKTLYISGGIVIFINILIYILALHYYLYELRADSNGVYYRKGIFVIRRYSYDQIVSCEITGNNEYVIRFADNRKAVLQFDENCYYLVNRFYKEKIHYISHPDDEPYVVRATKFYVGFSFVAFFVFVIFTVFIFVQGFIIGGILFGALAVFALLDFIKKLRDKITVTDEALVVERLFKKTKYIRVADIKSTKKKIIDNAEFTYAYGKKELLFRYSEIDFNSHRLESLLRERKRIR